MATATQVFTVEQWMDLPEERTQRTELVDGEIVPMGNARSVHERLKSIWLELLMGYMFQAKIGRVYSETMYRLETGLGRIPDVSVLIPDRHPHSDGPFEGAPDIAIEVVSSETSSEMTRKLHDYLSHGSKLVIYTDVALREFWAYYPEGTARRYSGQDRFETPLLPGFSLQAGQLFADL